MMRCLTEGEVKLIVSNVSYPHGEFVTGRLAAGFYVVYTCCSGRSSGKIYFDRYSLPSAVVDACFRAMTTFDEREQREDFRYKEKPVMMRVGGEFADDLAFLAGKKEPRPYGHP